MTHDELVEAIQARADRHGILSHYCKSAVRCVGTSGLPDVLLAGVGGSAWLEVKMPGDTLRSGQARWGWTLKAGGQIYEVIGAGDLAEGGAVDLLLDHLSQHQSA